MDFSYNQSAPSATQYSPFKIVYDFNQLTPLDLFSLPNTSLLNHKYGKVMANFVKKTT